MIEHAFRLTTPQDLKAEISKYATDNNVSGIILSGVGSLERAVLRMAGAKEIKSFNGPFEIVSLIGTLCPDGLHLHTSLSREDGSCIGGHVQDGCIVHTTVELVLGEMENFKFSRIEDPSTGYKELQLKRKT